MSNSAYAGPVGWLYDKATGSNSNNQITDYLDPGDIFGRQAAADVKGAGLKAKDELKALSQLAWDRQMQGLQMALGSMNNYNGVLSNLYGVPTNYYGPQVGGPGGGQQPLPPFGGQPGGGQAPPQAARPPALPSPSAPPPAIGAPGTAGPATEARYGLGHF